MNTSDIPDKLKTEIVVEWLIKNIRYDNMPPDEEDSEALLYNLVHLAREGEGFERYAYKDHQEEEIDSWLRPDNPLWNRYE